MDFRLLWPPYWLSRRIDCYYCTCNFAGNVDQYCWSYYLQLIIDNLRSIIWKTTLGMISIGLIIVYILQKNFCLTPKNNFVFDLGQCLSIDNLSILKSMFFSYHVIFRDKADRGNVSRFTGRQSDYWCSLASTILSIFLMGHQSIIMIVLFHKIKGRFFLFDLARNQFTCSLFFFLFFFFLFSSLYEAFEKMNKETMEAK